MSCKTISLSNEGINGPKASLFSAFITKGLRVLRKKKCWSHSRRWLKLHLFMQKGIKLTKVQLYIKVVGQGCEVFIIHPLYTMLVKVR